MNSVYSDYLDRGLVCVMENVRGSLKWFQWFYEGKKISNKIKRKVESDSAYDWLSENAKELGFDFEGVHTQTVTKDFYLKHKSK